METTEKDVEQMELTVIDKSIEVFKGGSAILRSNQTRADKALKVGGDILLGWDDAYAIENEEARRIALAAIDARSNKFLVNCGVAKKEMGESRKAITQLMDLIKTMFTESENKMDSKKSDIPMKVQGKRNQFAKEEIAYQEKKQKEAEEKAAKASEAAEISAIYRKWFAQKLIDYLAVKKQKMTNAFNAITLADFESKKENLTKLSCVFPVGDIDTIIAGAPAPINRYHKTEELVAIYNNERDAFDFPAQYKQYLTEVTELKQSLIDRLASKKAELDEQKRLADEAEEKLQATLKAQKAAEEKRLADIAAANNAVAKKKALAAAVAARKAEKEKLDALALAEEKRQQQAADDQKQREQEAADKIAADKATAEKKAQDDANLAEAAAKASALFEQTEASLDGPAPETRNGFVITVKHAAGWVELFQFWFTREANKLSIEDIGKKSLDQIKAFAEKAATKGEKIESKYLVYESETKAVNRKAKV